MKAYNLLRNQKQLNRFYNLQSVRVLKEARKMITRAGKCRTFARSVYVLRKIWTRNLFVPYGNCFHHVRRNFPTEILVPKGRRIFARDSINICFYVARLKSSVLTF